MKKLLLMAFSLFLFSYSSNPQPVSDAVSPYTLHYNEGVKAQKQEDYASAIGFYQQALGEKTEFPEAWNNLGFCYRMVAKTYLQQSGEAYDKALRYAPEMEEALEYQGEYFVLIGELEKAYQNYETLKQKGSQEAGELQDALDRVLKQAKKVLEHYAP